MKKVLMLFGFITLLLFSNCSKDSIEEISGDTSAIDNPENAVNLTARLSYSELDIAKAEFLRIMGTKEYINFSDASKAFANNLNGVASNAPIKDRTAFIEWINANLSSTSFVTTAEAVAAFDNMKLLGTIYVNANTSFWDSLRDSSLDDIRVIFSPTTIPPTATASGPCQRACQGVRNNNQFQADMHYYGSLHAAARDKQYKKFASIKSAYICATNNIGWQYDTCVSHC